MTDNMTEPVNLGARKGEIVGLAGQLGSGASDVLRAVAGHQPRVSGTVTVAGSTVPAWLALGRHPLRYRLQLVGPQA